MSTETGAAAKTDAATKTGTGTGTGAAARRLAAEALERIDQDGAYANLMLPRLLDRSGLESRDRHFVSELVYGTTRMRRSCDWLVDRFVINDLDPRARAFLRVGAYQLAFLDTPPHAAVSATVEAAPKKLRGLVNAVLRKVSTAGRDWPSEGVRLSYPDWLIERLTTDLGPDDALAALEAMNLAATVTERPDGYIQDRASQWVVDAVDARPGHRVLDLCAAPGGKATGLANTGAVVIAADLRLKRTRLIASNARRLELTDLVLPVAADGAAPPFAPGRFDRILVDAPCSGFGALQRRPDARWRIEDADIDTLAALQRRLVDAAVPLLGPGGQLVYSVCTLTAAETMAIDEHLAARHPHLLALDPPAAWRPLGRGARLLPQDEGTDGMYLLRLTSPAIAPR